MELEEAMNQLARSIREVLGDGLSHGDNYMEIFITEDVMAGLDKGLEWSVQISLSAVGGDGFRRKVHQV